MVSLRLGQLSGESQVGSLGERWSFVDSGELSLWASYLIFVPQVFLSIK
jgi:hypothetical protein